MSKATGAFEAGAQIGKQWAADIAKRRLDENNQRPLANLRSWYKTRIELDVWDPTSVYADLLSNGFLSGDDEVFEASEAAQRDARRFWREISEYTFPAEDDEQWEFCRGFVVGAVTHPKLEFELGQGEAS
jgi:hypothetical protein